MDQITLKYIIDFNKLLTASCNNGLCAYESIRMYILNNGCITMEQVAEILYLEKGHLVSYRGYVIKNYGWTQFKTRDSCTIGTEKGTIYYNIVTKSIDLSIPLNLKDEYSVEENTMNNNKEYAKQFAIEQLNTIINSNPDCDAEGTNDTTTVRISDEDYEYSIVRKDKVKYVALKDVVSYVKYIVTPDSTLWEHNRNVTFNSVIGLRPYVNMETLAQLFPRESYSFEARSKLYDDITYALSDPCCKTSRKDDKWLVYIGKDSMNKDVLELMRINKNSSFFDGRRVSLSKGETNDNI